jgi:hypothetical protein
MGAPLWAAVLRRSAADYRSHGIVFQLFESRPALERLPRAGIRLLAALHLCALDGSAPEIACLLPSCGGSGDADSVWDASRNFAQTHLDTIARLYERTPQTNEVARSTVLLGGLLAIARETGLPVRLLEIGASAGLNVRLDRYRYEGDGWSWGDPSSALVLHNRESHGRPAALDADLCIVERSACDLHPLDVTLEADRLYLRSFIWADQVERLERLDRACGVAQNVPMVVEESDALPWLRQRFRTCLGTATVLMHSMVFYYLTRERREEMLCAIADAAESASEDAPMAWLRLESDPIETRVTLWPYRREICIARSDGHGQDIEWCDS